MKPFKPLFEDLFGNLVKAEMQEPKEKKCKIVLSKVKTVIQIKPHLLPYLYRCGVGKSLRENEIVILKINNKSAFGEYLHNVPLFVNNKEINTKQIQVQYNSAKKEAFFYHYTFKNLYEIMVEHKTNIMLNRLLEDLFRVDFMSSIEYLNLISDEPNLSNSIRLFSEANDLENCGFDLECLRVYYYKELKKLAEIKGLHVPKFKDLFPEENVFDILKKNKGFIII